MWACKIPEDLAKDTLNENVENRVKIYIYYDEEEDVEQKFSNLLTFNKKIDPANWERGIVYDLTLNKKATQGLENYLRNKNRQFGVLIESNKDLKNGHYNDNRLYSRYKPFTSYFRNSNQNTKAKELIRLNFMDAVESASFSSYCAGVFPFSYNMAIVQSGYDIINLVKDSSQIESKLISIKKVILNTCIKNNANKVIINIGYELPLLNTLLMHLGNYWHFNTVKVNPLNGNFDFDRFNYFFNEYIFCNKNQDGLLDNKQINFRYNISMGHYNLLKLQCCKDRIFINNAKNVKAEIDVENQDQVTAEFVNSKMLFFDMRRFQTNKRLFCF